MFGLYHAIRKFYNKKRKGEKETNPYELKFHSRIYYKELHVINGDPNNCQVAIPWTWNEEGADINPALFLWESATWEAWTDKTWEVGKLRLSIAENMRPINVDPICDGCIDLDSLVSVQCSQGLDLFLDDEVPLRDCVGWQVLYILLDPMKECWEIDWKSSPPEDIVILLEMNYDGWHIFATKHNEGNQPISGYIRAMNSEGRAYFMSHIGALSKKMPRFEYTLELEKQLLRSMYIGRKIRLRHPYIPGETFQTRLRIVLARLCLDYPEQGVFTEHTPAHNSPKPIRHCAVKSGKDDSLHCTGGWYDHLQLISFYIKRSTVRLPDLLSVNTKKSSLLYSICK